MCIRDSTVTVSGSLDFSDFDSGSSNYKLVVGGRGDSTATLMNDYTETFTGQLKNLDQTIQAGAEYILLLILLFVGTLCYCALWAGGQWIVASKSAELNAEVKQGEKEQAKFVRKKLEQAPTVQQAEWTQQIEQWNQCKELYTKTNEADTEHRYLRVYGIRAFFFVLVVFDMFVVLWLAAPDGQGLYSSSNFATAFGKAWNFQAAPIGWIFLLSSIIETTLFTIGCVGVVWPNKNNDAQPHSQANPGQKEEYDPLSPESGRRVTALAEETNSTCLLIACHNSALDEGMRTDLERTLHAAMENFPPESIFVCDNGRGLHPSDDTQGLCDRVCRQRFPEESRKINYVFIPEGNKTHALYWVSEWWIPFLMQKDKIPDFEYLVMIDDDVPLPKNFDFHAAQMNAQPTMAACGYAITAVTPTDPLTGKSEPNFLVDMQDVEYRLSGFFKLVQARLGGSSFYAHGAVSLWRRKLLGREILYKHDTEFHGEDLYMGLLLHRQEQGNSIDFSAGNVVETFAPDHFKLLFKQRTKSWDLATHRKFPSILRELLFRWKNQFLFLKIFHFGEVIAVIQDWIRLYLFVLLLLTNPIVLAGITCFFFAIAYAQLILFRFVVLRNRPDLKKKLGAVSLLCFPLYKTGTTFMFRQYAMMENAFYYATNFKRHTVETRLTWSRDPELRARAIEELGEEKASLLMNSESANFPPRPMETTPNWWHLWQLPEDPSTQRVARQSQQIGCSALAPQCVLNRIEQLTSGHPPVLVATHPENQTRLSHMMLAHVALLQLGVESQHSNFRDEHRAACPVTLLRKQVFEEIISRMKIAPTALHNDGQGKNSMLKSEPARYQARLLECVEMWQAAINETMAHGIPKGDPKYARYMFMTKEIADLDPSYPWQRDLVKGTMFALTCVIEELSKMRIPDAHDPFSTTKKRIHDAMRELETGKPMKRS
eukprot:TRINITY_DN16688_c0_g1_i3.p1 TRINITY_DN16688_c0_g1~~TRINITY_DN16688_c0_g1_i3.p1  ORF type:complete len:940 (-),score=240.44 TRINITY_DN16688_c0_g1_i3:35-2854(-)